MNGDKCIEDYFVQVLPAKDISGEYVADYLEQEKIERKDYNSRLNVVAMKFKKKVLGAFGKQKIMPLEKVAEALCDVGIAKDLSTGITLAQDFNGKAMHYHNSVRMDKILYFNIVKNVKGQEMYRMGSCTDWGNTLPSPNFLYW